MIRLFVKRLRDLNERFIFQGGSDFALTIAFEIDRLDRNATHYQDEWSEVCNENQVLLNDLEKQGRAFNRAINHAIDLGSEGAYFLQCWREGDWDGCREFDFEIGEDA